MKIALIAPSTVLPVPAIHGGAIETLITGFIDKNEEKRLIQITVFSPYDKKAKLRAKKYVYTNFIWIRYTVVNKIVNLLTRSYSKISKRKIDHFGILQILNYLKRNNYSLVIVEGDEQLLFPVSRIVGTSRTVYHLHARLFISPEVYNYCSIVIAVSNYIKKQVLLNTRKSEESVIVIKNCIDIQKFNYDRNCQFRSEIRLKYNIADSELVICYTGRIVKEKGVMELLQSLLLLSESISFKAFIIGSPGSLFGLSSSVTSYYTELRSQADKLNNRIIFTGFVPNDRIPHFLAASDISVVPSMYEEPQGLTVLESFAAGLPVITTDSGGIPENVNEKTAIVIKRDQSLVSNMATAIYDLMKSEAKRKEMRFSALKYVQKFNFDTYYSDLVELFKEIK
ncbi:MAG: glycosyltransferase family 4 protein [Bacteroidales bacterium]|nr:glycosyltransferase family 4 protein [Bacteroidales bacterium]